MGKKTSVFVISLCLVIGLSKQDSFDYIQVVYEWQPAMCNTGRPCKMKPQNKFSIHGVWPSYYSSGQIPPCSGPSFNSSEIRSLEYRMNENWADLTDDNPTKMWGMKWANHGTCSATVFNQFQFFSIGLDAYGRHSMFSFLIRGNVLPIPHKTVSKTSVIKAIADKTSKKGGAICSVVHQSLVQLQKAVLCYAKDGSTLIDCPDNVSNSCPDQFLWLLQMD